MAVSLSIRSAIFSFEILDSSIYAVVAELFAGTGDHFDQVVTVEGLGREGGPPSEGFHYLSFSSML